MTREKKMDEKKDEYKEKGEESVIEMTEMHAT